MDSFELEVDYNAPINKVWRALSKKDLLKKWYFDIPDFKAEIGAKFFFSGWSEGKEYIHNCQILVVKPENLLVYSWTYEGYKGISEVRFVLIKRDEGRTKLLFKHSGIDSFPKDVEALSYNRFEEGWNVILQELLLEFVEKGNVN